MFTRLASWFKSRVSSARASGRKAVSSATAWASAWFRPEKPRPLDCVLAAEQKEILNARALRRQELVRLAQEDARAKGEHATVPESDVPEFELVHILKRILDNRRRKSASTTANVREDSASGGGHQGGFEL